MTLADRLDQAPRRSRGTSCRLGWVLEQLSDAERAALNAALITEIGNPDRIASTDIGEALRAEGYDVHNKTVETHRKGACNCEPAK